MKYLNLTILLSITIFISSCDKKEGINKPYENISSVYNLVSGDYETLPLETKYALDYFNLLGITEISHSRDYLDYSIFDMKTKNGKSYEVVLEVDYLNNYIYIISIKNKK